MQLATQNDCDDHILCFTCFQASLASHGTMDGLPNGITIKVCPRQPNSLLEVPRDMISRWNIWIGFMNRNPVKIQPDLDKKSFL